MPMKIFGLQYQHISIQKTEIENILHLVKLAVSKTGTSAPTDIFSIRKIRVKREESIRDVNKLKLINHKMKLLKRLQAIL